MSVCVQRVLRRIATPSSALLSMLALMFAGLTSGSAGAQELPPGIALGMTQSEVLQVMPQLEKPRRPTHMAGGLVGTLRLPDVSVFGLTGEQTLFFANGRLNRVEFVGNGAVNADGAQGPDAFERIVEWGRSLYGREIAANDAGSSYAAWSAGDTEVYVQRGGPSAAVRLVYKLRPVRDASQL